MHVSYIANKYIFKITGMYWIKINLFKSITAKIKNLIIEEVLEFYDHTFPIMIL